MAQNITLLGASYSAVPAVTLPKTGGGTASFTDVTDTTAAASDVASGKYFYTAAGVRTQGTNSGGGGASNVVTGTFKGTTTGAAMSVNINYNGTGYPISMIIYPTGGIYGNSTFSSLIQKSAISTVCGTKYEMSTSPNYSGSGENSQMTISVTYKDSTTNAVSYSTTGSYRARLYRTGSASGSSSTSVARFTSNVAMSVFIAGTSYGFAPNIEYTYQVIYSS